MTDDHLPCETNTEETTQVGNLLRTTACVLFIGFLVLASIWVLLGITAVEKIVVDAVMPLPIIAWTLLTLMVASVRSKRPRQYLPIGIATVFVFAIGNQFVADFAVGTLEQQYADIDPLTLEKVNAIVLLGGGTRETPCGQFQVNHNGDRVVTAARMFHQAIADRIFCTGTRSAEVTKSATDEAFQAKSLLVDLGVPEGQIIILGGKNTADEMKVISRHLVANELNERIGLVTSAWHLPRAMRLATANGIDAIPIPAHFVGRGVDGNRSWGSILRDCVPSHDALMINSRVLKEYLAWFVGR